MFGQSVFESVLDRLKAEAREAARQDEEAKDDAAGGVRGLPSGFAGLGTGHAFASGNQAQAAYLDLYEDPAPPPPDPSPLLPPEALATAPPSHLLRVAPDEVAADLGLDGSETIAELADRRRAFARANHPDRVPTDLRDNATMRMKIANMLIDETVRRINARAALGL